MNKHERSLDAPAVALSENWDTPITDLEIALTPSIALLVMQGRGYIVTESVEFELIWHELVASTKGRVNKESDPAYSDLSDDDAKYLVIRDTSGSLAGFACIRRFRLGDDGLKGHLTRQYRRIYGEGQTAFRADRLPPITEKVTGTVVCISDIFIERNARGHGRLDPNLIAALAFGRAALWRPDWVYGFTKHRDIGRGLAQKYMPSKLYPSAIEWLVETPNRANNDWLLLWEWSDLCFILRHLRREYSHELIVKTASQISSGLTSLPSGRESVE